ncbi:16S rRNA (cytosine(1407)-C(5))-methyltransferase RsmF [Agarivorans aestuarii]|uniref:Ribosomal RNA small subunit methyltransferase F n=1 Tax=Agarivorans aestuarii TaxID=1563703 RepID=A0ABU7G1J1_9ALTE|nr:16S rRNA (cytosine(1407)-C(5))-methyltransferase RsmF [Agarivorans aestuarii]MEE1673185.1 16S rRNA (cytosine(1407)-C(5))-methyltransferase RsmF [Agarivorans aestuarii]
MTKSINFPAKFIERIEKDLPDDLSLASFKAICQQEMRKSIRVNTLKISVKKFLQLANSNQWQLEPIPWCSTGFWITREDESLSLGNTAEHQAGLFYIQEASSMLPVSALFHCYQADENSLLLDAAAAPGSKTTQIAAELQGRGAIVANEYSASRVKVLSANLLRCGVSNVAVTHFSAEVFGTWMSEQFDAILLDAPCSGEGTLRKDPQALDNWSEQHVDEISKLQTDLLESALQALKPDGFLIYSTCTLNQQENQQVINNIADKYPDSFATLSLEGLFEHSNKALTAEGYLHVWPQYYDSEGFFVAALRKNAGSIDTPLINKRIKPFAYQQATKKQQVTIAQHFSSQFGVTFPENYSVFTKANDYWLLPDSFLPVKDEMRFERVGLKLAEEFKHGFRTSHYAITALGHLVSKNRVELDAEQAHHFYQGKDIAYPNTNKGEVALSYQGYVIGLGKWVRNKVKNSYPRELVKDKGLA